jgi:hypothetical protein
MHLMLYRSAFTLATEYARNPAQHNSVLKVRWNLPWSDRSVEGPVAISEEYVLHMRELSAVQTMATAVHEVGRQRGTVVSSDLPDRFQVVS